MQAVSPNKTLRQNAAIEIRVSDVVPLPLETVFVSVDKIALQKLEDAQKDLLVASLAPMDTWLQHEVGNDQSARMEMATERILKSRGGSLWNSL